MPGYELQSVEGEFPPKLLCSVCRLLMRDPIQTFDGVRMCRSCLTTRVLKDQGETPQWFSDRAIQKEILDWKVRCKNVSKSCSWQGRFKDLDSHRKHQCQYEPSARLPNQITEESITAVQMQLHSLVEDLKTVQGVVRGLQKRVKVMEVKLQQQEEQILKKDGIIAQQNERLSLCHISVQQYEPHSQGLATFAVTAVPQQVQCESKGATESKSKGGADQSHEVEGLVMETKEIMRQNIAMIMEGNRENAKFMEGAAAVMKSITPTSKK